MGAGQGQAVYGQAVYGQAARKVARELLRVRGSLHGPRAGMAWCGGRCSGGRGEKYIDKPIP